MNYRLVYGVAALTLALSGCVNDNPFYVDPTGDTSSTSEDPTMTAGESSTSAATTEEPTLSTGSTGDATTGGTSSTGVDTGSVTSDTGDETGDDTTDDTGDSSTTMPAGFCGDGIVDPGELCDDGDEDDSNGCTVACLPPPQLDLDQVMAPELTDIVGTPGSDSSPGLCPGALVGMGISGSLEIGVLRAKLACQSFDIIPIGEGVFQVVLQGDESYGPYSGNMGEPDLVKGALCPEESPILVGVNGWFGEPEMTKIEIRCAQLHLVPSGESYKVKYIDKTTVAEGYNDWGEKGTAVGCESFPGTVAVDVIIHTTEYGVSGLKVLCAEPSFI